MTWQERLFIIIATIVALGTTGLIFISRPHRTEVPATALPESSPQETPMVTYLDPSFGKSNAKKTVVLYGNYACAHCATASAEARKLVAANPEVRLIWKDLPSGTEESVLASEAGQCANRQGKFWEYHDALYASGGDWSETSLMLLANRLDLDTVAFGACMERHESRPFVEHTVAEGIALGIEATPTAFIGKTRYVGQLSYEQLHSAIK